MHTNEIIIREIYSFAEGDSLDVDKFASSFSGDGYMTDIPAGLTLRGKAISDYVGTFAAAFPDLHRELLSVYAVENVVVVELAIRGTHKGALSLPSGTLAPTGRTINVPCCDVFHLEDRKVTSFHCYNAASVLLQQLGVLG